MTSHDIAAAQRALRPAPAASDPGSFGATRPTAPPDTDDADGHAGVASAGRASDAEAHRGTAGVPGAADPGGGLDASARVTPQDRPPPAMAWGGADAGGPALAEDGTPLIACPTCDALYRVQMPDTGGRAVCARCHRVLISPRERAGLRAIALSVAVAILVTAAVFFPFLEIRAAGIGNRASILDVATSFRSGILVAVSVATVAVIVLFPLMRVLLLLYVLVPLVYRDQPARHAHRAFRLAQEMKPWAMTEIFIIGCAVALVKVASLATLELGPAFWMFAVLVLVALVNDRYLCTWSIWQSIDRKG